MVYKALNNQAPDYIIKLFKLKTSNRTLRSDKYYKMLEIPYVKKATFAMRALSVQGPKIWNELPNDIKMQVTLDSFKAKLKIFLFKEAYKC